MELLVILFFTKAKKQEEDERMVQERAAREAARKQRRMEKRNKKVQRKQQQRQAHEQLFSSGRKEVWVVPGSEEWQRLRGGGGSWEAGDSIPTEGEEKEEEGSGVHRMKRVPTAEVNG